MAFLVFTAAAGQEEWKTKLPFGKRVGLWCFCFPVAAANWNQKPELSFGKRVGLWCFCFPVAAADWSLKTICTKKFIGEKKPNCSLLCSNTFFDWFVKCWNFLHTCIARKIVADRSFLGGCAWSSWFSPPRRAKKNEKQSSHSEKGLVCDAFAFPWRRPTEIKKQSSPSEKVLVCDTFAFPWLRPTEVEKQLARENLSKKCNQINVGYVPTLFSAFQSSARTLYRPV